MFRNFANAAAAVILICAIFAPKAAHASPAYFKVYDLPAPDYPGRCLNAGIEGTVMLAFKLRPSGELERVTVIHAPKDCPEFGTAAVAAMKKAHYTRPPRGHRVTEEVMLIPVNFTINE